MNTPAPCDRCKYVYSNVLCEDDESYSAECKLDQEEGRMKSQGLKRIAMARVIFVLIVSVLVMSVLSLVYAQVPTATSVFEWTPPTHRAGGTPEVPDCNVQGTALTPEEISTLYYVFSYRKSGMTTWTDIETRELGITLTGLDFNTGYQATVGGHWLGRPVVCPTNVVEWTTGSTPAPGLPILIP